MEWFRYIILIFVSIPLLDGSKFRSDYTYSSEIQGWLKLHEQATSVENAENKCASEGSQLATPRNGAMQRAMLMMMHQNIHTVHTGLPVFYNDSSIDDSEIWVLQNNAEFKKVGRSESHPYFCFHRDTISIKGCGAKDDGYQLKNQTGQCYKLQRKRATWIAARDTCVREGGHLAVINSDTEAKELQSLFYRNPPKKNPIGWPFVAFIGIRKVMVWRTIFGKTLEETGYNRWAPHEPNNDYIGAGGNCGAFDRNGLLYENPCTRKMPYICERNADTPLV